MATTDFCKRLSGNAAHRSAAILLALLLACSPMPGLGTAAQQTAGTTLPPGAVPLADEATRAINKALDDYFARKADQITGDKDPAGIQRGLLEKQALILLQEVYMRDLTNYSNWIATVADGTDAQIDDLVAKLEKDAESVYSAYSKMQWAASGFNPLTPDHSASAEKANYEALLRDADRAEKQGDPQRAAMLRQFAKESPWGTFLPFQRRFYESLDKNPLLGIQIKHTWPRPDGDYLFNLLRHFWFEGYTANAKERAALRNLVRQHLQAFREQTDEERDRISKLTTLEDYWELAGLRYIRQQEKAAQMGPFARGLINALSGAQEGFSASNAVDEGWKNFWISVVVAGTALIPVVGPFASAGIQLYHDGSELVIAYVDNANVENAAGVLGYVQRIDSAERLSDARFRTLIAAAMFLPTIPGAVDGLRNAGVKIVHRATAATKATAEAEAAAAAARASRIGAEAPKGVPEIPGWAQGRQPISEAQAEQLLRDFIARQDKIGGVQEVEAEIALARNAKVPEDQINQLTKNFKPGSTPVQNRAIATQLMEARLQALGFDITMSAEEFRTLQGLSVRAGPKGAGLTLKDFEYLHTKLAAEPNYLKRLPQRGYVTDFLKDKWYEQLRPQEGFVAGLDAESAANLEKIFQRWTQSTEASPLLKNFQNAVRNKVPVEQLKDTAMSLKADPQAMRSLKNAPVEVREAFNEAEAAIYQQHDNAVVNFVKQIKRDKQGKPAPWSQPGVEVKVDDFRTPGGASLGVNTDRDYRILYMSPEKGWLEVPKEYWQDFSTRQFAKASGYTPEKLMQIASPEDVAAWRSWDPAKHQGETVEQAMIDKWKELHQQLGTDKFHPEASVEFSDQEIVAGERAQVSANIKAVKKGEALLKDPEGFGMMYNEKADAYLRLKSALHPEGDKLEAMAQLNKGIDMLNDVRAGYAKFFQKAGAKPPFPPLPKNLQEAADAIQSLAPFDKTIAPDKIAAVEKKLRDLGFAGQLRNGDPFRGFVKALDGQFEAFKTIEAPRAASAAAGKAGGAANAPNAQPAAAGGMPVPSGIPSAANGAGGAVAPGGANLPGGGQPSPGGRAPAGQSSGSDADQSQASSGDSANGWISLGKDSRPGDFSLMTGAVHKYLTSQKHKASSWKAKRNPDGTVTYTSPDGQNSVIAKSENGQIFVLSRTRIETAPFAALVDTMRSSTPGNMDHAAFNYLWDHRVRGGAFFWKTANPDGSATYTTANGKTSINVRTTNNPSQPYAFQDVTASIAAGGGKPAGAGKPAENASAAGPAQSGAKQNQSGGAAGSGQQQGANMGGGGANAPAGGANAPGTGNAPNPGGAPGATPQAECPEAEQACAAEQEAFNQAVDAYNETVRALQEAVSRVEATGPELSAAGAGVAATKPGDAGYAEAQARLAKAQVDDRAAVDQQTKCLQNKEAADTKFLQAEANLRKCLDAAQEKCRKKSAAGQAPIQNDGRNAGGGGAAAGGKAALPGGAGASSGPSGGTGVGGGANQPAGGGQSAAGTGQPQGASVVGGGAAMPPMPTCLKSADDCAEFGRIAAQKEVEAIQARDEANRPPIPPAEEAAARSAQDEANYWHKEADYAVEQASLDARGDSKKYQASLSERHFQEYQAKGDAAQKKAEELQKQADAKKAEAARAPARADAAENAAKAAWKAYDACLRLPPCPQQSAATGGGNVVGGTDVAGGTGGTSSGYSNCPRAKEMMDTVNFYRQQAVKDGEFAQQASAAGDPLSAKRFQDRVAEDEADAQRWERAAAFELMRCHEKPDTANRVGGSGPPAQPAPANAAGTGQGMPTGNAGATSPNSTPSRPPSTDVPVPPGYDVFRDPTTGKATVGLKQFGSYPPGYHGYTDPETGVERWVSASGPENPPGTPIGWWGVDPRTGKATWHPREYPPVEAPGEWVPDALNGYKFVPASDGSNTPSKSGATPGIKTAQVPDEAKLPPGAIFATANVEPDTTIEVQESGYALVATADVVSAKRVNPGDRLDARTTSSIAFDDGTGVIIDTLKKLTGSIQATVGLVSLFSKQDYPQGVPVQEHPPGVPVQGSPPGVPVQGHPPGLPVQDHPPGLPVQNGSTTMYVGSDKPFTTPTLSIDNVEKTPDKTNATFLDKSGQKVGQLSTYNGLQVQRSSNVRIATKDSSGNVQQQANVVGGAMNASATVSFDRPSYKAGDHGVLQIRVGKYDQGVAATRFGGAAGLSGEWIKIMPLSDVKGLPSQVPFGDVNLPFQTTHPGEAKVAVMMPRSVPPKRVANPGKDEVLKKANQSYESWLDLFPR